MSIDSERNIDGKSHADTLAGKNFELESRLEKLTLDLSLKESRFRELFSHMRDAVMIFDARLVDGNPIVTDVNDVALKVEKRGHSEMINHPITEILPACDKIGLLQALLDVHSTGKSREIPERFYEDQRISGWREYFIYRLPSHEVVAIYKDITYSKKIEDKLYEALDTTSEILGNLPVAVLVEDENRRIERVNDAALKLFGKDLQGLLQHHEMEYYPRNAIPADKSSECQISDNEGNPVSVLRTCIPLKIQDKTKLLLTFVDLTSQKRLEIELHQAQKLEAVGQLAAGIAHEINTPIQYVGDNMVFLKESFKKMLDHLMRIRTLFGQLPTQIRSLPSFTAIQENEQKIDLPFLLEEIPRAIDETHSGSQKVAKIVQSMKEFSHPGVELASIDINKALESTVTISHNVWKYVAEVKWELDTNLPMVTCLPGEINQVFLNLIVNASHAIEDVASNLPRGKGTITIGTFLKNEYVVISISDTGSGIPDAVKEKIFEPFFTTKKVGRGTGQGLFMAHKTVVDNHGGKIEFDSTLGKGTSFRLFLPLKKGGSEGGKDV